MSNCVVKHPTQGIISGELMDARQECPNAEDLQNLLSGRISHERIVELEAHLTCCEACIQTAETLVDSDPLLRLVRVKTGKSPDAFDDNLTNQLISQVLKATPKMLANSDNWHTDVVMVGQFRIIRRLGSGGFGIVYLAVDTQLNRRVALKIPRFDLSLHPELRSRFLREARAVAGLDHHGVVSLYEAGNVDGQCYLAFAYCSGPSLAEWLASCNDPVAPDEAARFILHLAEALIYTHQRGVLHRDLKPGNVMLCLSNGEIPPDEGRRQLESMEGRPFALSDCVPKITDFGLAKVLTEEGLPETRASQTLGTPQYMAPEQAAGHNEVIGPTTDVYALGAILYELLTGRPPFEGATFLQLFNQIAHVEPIPLRLHCQYVPRDLELICLTCLQKEQSRRYASAAALAEDVQHFLHGRPIRARPIGQWERLIRWARRQPKVASLAAVSAAATILLAVAGVMFGVVTSSFNSQLTGALHEAQDHRYAADVIAASYALNTGRADQAKELLATHVTDDMSWDRRCFAWNYLWSSVERSARVESLYPPGPAMTIDALDISPTKEILATNGISGELLFWDNRTGAVIERVLVDPSREIGQLAYSPDGRFLAVVMYGSMEENVPEELQLWENQGKWIQRWKYSILAKRLYVNFSFDSSQVWVGVRQNQNRVVCFTTSTGTEMRSFTIAGNAEARIALSRDGQFLAVTSDSNVLLYPLTQPDQTPRVLNGHINHILYLAFSHDSKSLATGGFDKEVLLWSTKTGRKIGQFPGHEQYITGISFHPNGRTLATTDLYGGVRIFSISSPNRLDHIRTNRNTGPIVFGDGGRSLYFGAGTNAGIRLWQPFSIATSDPYEATTEIWGLAFSADGKSLLAATDDSDGSEKTLHLLQWNKDKQLERTWSHQGHQATATGACFLPGGRVATCGLDRRLRVRELNTGTLVWETEAHSKRGIWCLAVSSDGTRLATGCYDGLVKVWDASNGVCLHTLHGHGTELVRGITFNTAGDSLVSAGEDGKLCVWNLTTGGLQGTWRGDLIGTQKLTCLTLSKDGRTAITGDQRGRIHFIDVDACILKSSLTGHSGGVNAVSISPDGRCLATGSEDQTVKIWHLTTRKELLVFTDHRHKINALTFSPDGQLLASGDHSGQIRIWSTVGSKSR